MFAGEDFKAEEMEATGTKMNLISVGYFKEMSQGRSTDPSIHQLVNKGDSRLIEKICAYLDEGCTVIVSPGVTKDVIDESTESAGTGSAYTDGKWLWPDDLSYYVRKYNISIPEDFLETMEENNWENPGGKMDLSDAAIIVDGIEL